MTTFFVSSAFSPAGYILVYVGKSEAQALKAARAVMREYGAGKSECVVRYMPTSATTDDQQADYKRAAIGKSYQRPTPGMSRRVRPILCD